MAKLKEDLPIGFIMCALTMLLGCATIIRIKYHEDTIQETIQMIEERQYILQEDDYNLIENWE